MRGAVISVLSIWEFYVVNLSEAFNDVVHIHNEVNTPDYSSGDSSGTDDHGRSHKELRKVKQEWPECQTVIQSAFKRVSL